MTRQDRETIVPPTDALAIAVLTVSDTRTLETDSSGARAAELFEAAGHRIAARQIVQDDFDAIVAALSAAIADSSIDVVVATGGSGVTARDVTPEAMQSLATKHIPGFGELFRWISYEEIGTSTIQSRADAAVCSGTLVFVIPGSTGAVQTAVSKILVPQLDINNKPCNFAELLPRIRGESAPE
jgi:molybdenum cofactor biosynthesis protein B